MNNTKTGNNIAAAIEPTETIFVIAINNSANIRHIKPIFQLTKSNTPSDVATPFPPLNSKNIGNACPKTTNIPAIWASIAPSTFFTIFPAITATIIATTPFNISHINVIAAAFFLFIFTKILKYATINSQNLTLILQRI